MDRRTFLSATAVAAAAPVVGVSAAAQPAPAAPRPSRLDQLAEAAAEHRLALQYDGKRFSGPGYDWLLRQGSQAQAFLLGEEHGIAENPTLAAQLFTDLVPRGYRNVAIEISPPMADAVDAALAAADPGALRHLFTAPESRVAFFGMREEADWLRSARAALPGAAPFLWGLDYEVAADRYLINQLKEASKPAAASAALMKLADASAASWAKYEQTRNPQFIFSFAGDPKLVEDLRAAWPAADGRSRLIMDTLERTLAINALWVAGKSYESNLVRAQFLRANLLRYWQAREHSDPDARLFMKMGASHLVRGVNMSDVFDLGTLLPELAALRGGRTFHLLVLPGPGTQTANLDPTRFVYAPGNRDEYGEGMEIFDKAILLGAAMFTLFDTAPLRAIASSHAAGVPLPLWRVIHGFDAILVMTGSTPSSNI